ncbi:hypothetical protein M427DRAFT_158085 [Gonapodya prolifera JEL478]|uniref:Non-specific serine/threonine protein kinase n=1 Tax=Gonapodya prolifera (strain JEL478) TaxID=1344416 RepID=A0A139A4X1_GONPJ|nr:hypothetical protein M427DRAFT_158085 [Gonapodya prolifera JEL478]|eukprot:KXS11669.1 hypothetical protein M427DRAFT_158085 [Gonapodya prolifera JEL478]
MVSARLTSPADLANAASKLADPAVDISVKIRIVSDIKESLELFQSADFLALLDVLVPAFESILTSTVPTINTNTEVHRLRNQTLEVLSRFPPHEGFKDHALRLAKTLLDVLKTDNEDNGAVCLRTIVEMHKTYRQLLEEEVKPLMDIVHTMYENMVTAVNDTFDITWNANSPDPPPQGTNPQNIASTSPGESEHAQSTAAQRISERDRDKPNWLAHSLFSFKVLKECPINIVMLLQVYKKLTLSTIEQFVPLIINVLALQPNAQKIAHDEAAERGEIFVGVSPNIKNRGAYGEFKSMQIKTLSFIAYILRNFIQNLKPYQQKIAEGVMALMKDCPPEMSAIRKELLVATRHIWASEFRSSFVPHIDTLLNEKVVVGTGVTSRETLRPLAHSFLADLLHHVRMELSPVQLSRIVYTYARNLHDFSFAPQIQTMCSKLLLNLIDCIDKHSASKDDSRKLFIKILDAFATKLTSIVTAYPLILKYNSRKKALSNKRTEDEKFVPEPDMYLELEFLHPIKSYQGPFDSSQDVVKEMKFLFRNLVTGIKTILIAIRSSNPPPPEHIQSQNEFDAWNSVARGFTESESAIFNQILHDGVRCFDLFLLDGDTTAARSIDKSPLNIITVKEEKEVLEAFASIFTHIEAPIFLEVMSCNIGFLVDQISVNATLLALPHCFFLNAAISPSFSGILIRYLVDRMDLIGAGEPKSSVMIRLFKLIFLAVTVFPDKNEIVLQPHLGNIIRTCLKMAGSAKDPLNYFILLRQLFRSIGGGRFELLYKEVLPMLQELLEVLNSLLANAQKSPLRDLFVELCLTVPVRLSVLLPYLNYLMKPLVLALGSSELVSQGLRTLELCIDNLTHEFLDPILQPIIGDLMTALFRHLRPTPYNPSHSHATLRILGKLGGRNRRILKESPVLRQKPYADVYGLTVGLQFDIGQTLSAVPTSKDDRLNIDAILDLSLRVLSNQVSSREHSSSIHHYKEHAHYYKEQAFNFLKGCLPLVFNSDSGGQDGGDRMANAVSRYLLTLEAKPQDPTANSEGRDEPGASDSMDIDIQEQLAPQPDSYDPRASPTQGMSRSQREAQERVVTKIMTGLLLSAGIEDLRERATPLLENVVRHFALLHVEEKVLRTLARGKKNYGPSNLEVDLDAAAPQMEAFVESFVDVMTSENKEMRTIGTSILKLFYDTALTALLGRKNAVDQLPVFKSLALRFCLYCCKQEWYRKSGGCWGISVLSSQLDLGVRWTYDHELDFVKALLYVLKDTSEFANSNVDDAKQTLSQVLKICNQPDNADEPQTDRQHKFNTLISLLVTELSHSNSTVRETIQSSLQLLHDLTGIEITELLTPARERLLTPIFTKPLRALPIPLQIGHIDAITYCLSLRPHLLTFNEELVRLLHEALALADAEDQALAQKGTSYKSMDHLTQLRVVCIRLLSSAMACPDFVNPKPNLVNARARITSVFFKSLYTKSPEVVDCANKGLHQVLQQQKLPKELLQQGLRPILMNLADYKKLTVAGLEGLARLLELLTNYFKVEIGRKLIDHMKMWAAPPLETYASKPLSEIDEVQIIVAILEVFHLLPSKADMFLEDLVHTVIELEARLRRTTSSPFRAPLVKFLNHYHVEAVVFFLDRVADPRVGKLFVDLLKLESATKFRAELMGKTDLLVEKTFNAETDSEEESRIRREQGIRIVRDIALLSPEWLLQNRNIWECVLQTWRSPNRKRDVLEEEKLDLESLRQSRFIMDILIAYNTKNPSETSLLFDMVEVFTNPTIVDFSFLKRYLWEEVALKYSVDLRRQIIHQFLDMLDDSTISQDLKVQALRMLIIPITLVSFSKPGFDNTIDNDIVDRIHAKLWVPCSEEKALYPDDFLKIELLQLTTLLVQYGKDIIGDHRRKALIKYEWNLIKVEDPTCKMSAHVGIACFIEQFDTPGRIMISSFVALLRQYQSENKTLVRQALDILLPVLPKRLDTPQNQSEKKGDPPWIRWGRKILVDDANNIPQLVNIYTLIVRHSHLYYDNRGDFLPLIIQNLAKLGVTPNASQDWKVLSIDLVELILDWERQRIAEGRMDIEMDSPIVQTSGKRSASAAHLQTGPPAKRQQLEGGTAQTSGPSDSSRDSLPLGLKETVISFATRFLTTLQDPVSKKGFSNRVATLVKDLLAIWPDVNFNPMTFHKVFAQEPSSDQIVMVQCNALELLYWIVESKDASWFMANIGHLHGCLGPLLRSENPRIASCIEPIVQLIYLNSPALQTTNSADFLSFTKMVDALIQNGLTTQTNPISVISLLTASAKGRPETLDTHIQSLSKMFQNLVKAHLSPPPPAPPKDAAQPPQEQRAASGASTAQPHSVPTPEASGPVVIALLNLLKLRVSSMASEHRRSLLISLMQLIEKSSDVEMLRAILDLVSEWVMAKAESFPTIKEKAALMLRLMTIEQRRGDKLDHRGDKTLMERYLTLVADIYSDPSFAKSELTVKLEHAFLTACRNENPIMRQRFIRLLDSSVRTALFPRLNYMLGVQNWEALADYFWIHITTDLLLSSVGQHGKLSKTPTSSRVMSLALMQQLPYEPSVDPDLAQREFQKLFRNHASSFLTELGAISISELITPLRNLLHIDTASSYKMWVSLFPICWGVLSNKERHDLVKVFVPILAKDFHAKQSQIRPNIVQCLLEGLARCVPAAQLPPALIKYLGKTYNAWHIAISLLENLTISDTKTAVVNSSKEEEKIRELTLDALAELYNGISEDDYFFGLWRRRCIYSETNAALSYEQMGMWPQAQGLFEAAQEKAKMGVLAFSEGEYYLWEDHWVNCTQKLQQWDILADFSRVEGNVELLLECAWRISDWTADKENLQQNVMALPDSVHSRRKFFEAFLLLQPEKAHDFQKSYEEGVQLSLRKWISLPEIVSNSHVSLLHHFQQQVELTEALHIQSNLAATNETNIDAKSQELKGLLQTWRERLPNQFEDINIWSDLVSWRQHIFSTINRSYLPLLPLLSQGGGGTNPSSSYGYRGYHETAWIINRFAHVARKQGLTEVCISSLSRIYTLPNIEIQEAFYKLREQAKCHFQSPAEYASGLDVINNTNLVYFNSNQKAEFFTLKGQFLSKLQLHEEANQAFSSATQIEMQAPKAWAAWGQYNDRMFKEQPTELKWGANAINCYMQAAGIYKNARSRKFIARVLWLLSFDDGNAGLFKAFDAYKGEYPTWFWIIWIPQLLMSLSNKENRHASTILKRIAKQYPQALHFHLRTAREEHALNRKNAATAQSAQAQSTGTTQPSGENAANTSANGSTPPQNGNSDEKTVTGGQNQNGTDADSGQQDLSRNQPMETDEVAAQPAVKKLPWELIEEIHSMLKTAFPLLALSMETMVDQIIQRLKPTADDDMYRLIAALLNDAVTNLAQKAGTDDFSLPKVMEQNLQRLAGGMNHISHIKYKVAFEQDFIKTKPTLVEVVVKFRDWRDKLEQLLDSRSRRAHLEHYSHYLVEFEHQKFDEIEIPGQYLLHKDSSMDFIRIDRFQPDVEIVRSYGSCLRRLTIRGHDGSLHPFLVQNPATRQGRREERILQLFRILNTVLERKKESRRRRLYFHVPCIIPLSNQVRLVQDDPSYHSLYEIYEDHCESVQLYKDEPTVYYIKTLVEMAKSQPPATDGSSLKKQKAELTNCKIEILDHIGSKMAPDTMLQRFMASRMETYSDLWAMRKQFTQQYASMTFMSYVMGISPRYPSRIVISCNTGSIWAAELYPAHGANALLGSSEKVPFRLTPNIQTFMTPTGVEGVFTSSLMAIARSLTEPEFDVEDYTGLFVRDELLILASNNTFTHNKALATEQQLKDAIANNVDLISKRISSLSCRIEREKQSAEASIPVNQTIIDLISAASNPHNLAQMDIAWVPWL